MWSLSMLVSSFTVVVIWLAVTGEEQPAALPSFYNRDGIDTGIGILERPNTLIVLKKQPLWINCSVVVEEGLEPVTFYWKKDGILLKSREHSRVRVLDNGTLHFKKIIHRDRGKVKTDEGFYECFVRNSLGTVIGRRVDIKVARVSKSFSQEPQSKTAKLGTRVVFDCAINAVTETHFQWEQNKTPLKVDGSKYYVHESGKLQINHIETSDAGNYKCIAANKALFGIEMPSLSFRWHSSEEATLHVKDERPSSSFLEMLINPATETKVVLGGTTTLECIVNGNPEPLVTWTKDGKDILFPDVEKIPGGSLLFQKVRREHEGLYKCDAKLPNSEEHYEATSMLKVLVEPVIEVGPQSGTLPVAKVMVLECKATGHPTPTLTWLKDGKEIAELGPTVVTVLKDNVLELRYYGVVETDSGYYQCLAENEAGRASSIARIKIWRDGNAPNPPRNLKVIVLSSTEAEVSWTLNRKNGSLPIIGITVHYRKQNNSALDDVILTNATNRTVIQRLEPWTNYTLHMVAFNIHGASVASHTVNFTTFESVPRGYPEITAFSESPNTILVKWSEIPASLRGGVIRKYRILFRRFDTEEVKEEVVDGSTREFFFKDLLPDTEYEIRIAGATQHGYPNPDMVEFLWTRLRTPMNESNNRVTPTVTMEKINTTTMRVTWTYKKAVNMTRQIIYLRNLQQSAIKMFSMDGNLREIYFQNLVPDTTYEFHLLGKYGNHQTGPVTKTFSTATYSTDPSDHIVGNLTGNAILHNTILVKWSYLADNSPEITHFVVKYKPAASEHVCFDHPEKSFITHTEEAVLTDLEAYTIYNISVCAFFDNDQSEYSSPLLIRTLEDIPTPPEDVAAEIISDGKVRIHWNPPHHPNGYIHGHVISYNMELIKSDKWTEIYQEGQETSSLVQNLTAKTYYFRVQACNGAGKSDPSKRLEVRLDQDKSDVRQGLSDQQLGILGGATIGLSSIIITVIVVYCRQRHFPHQYSRNVERRNVPVAAPAEPGLTSCKEEKPVLTDPNTLESQVLVGGGQHRPPETDLRLPTLTNTHKYKEGHDTQAEELLALLASRDGSHSASGDSQSGSTERTQDDDASEELPVEATVSSGVTDLSETKC